MAISTASQTTVRTGAVLLATKNVCFCNYLKFSLEACLKLVKIFKLKHDKKIFFEAFVEMLQVFIMQGEIHIHALYQFNRSF